MILNRIRALAFISLIAMVALAVLVVVQLAAKPGEPACSEKPAFARAPDWLAQCLSANASVPEVEALFKKWGYIGSDWGGVSLAHLLPGEDQELVIHYHPDSAIAGNTFWDPQGKLVVMQPQARHWQIVFEAPLVITSTESLRAWESWNYRLLAASDLTGDGLDDLLVEARWSNGTHSFLRYLNLLTAHPQSSELRMIFVEDASLTNPTYHVVEFENRLALQSVIQVKGQDAITRTALFDGAAFKLVKETIDPALCTASTTLPDDSVWCGFDEFDGGGGVAWGEPLLGLYRLEGDRLSHFDIPGPLYALKPGTDGSLYVAAHSMILKYSQDQWETLLDLNHTDQHVFTDTFIPFDLALAPNGDLWVGGIFSLAHFDGQTWIPYAIPARRILVAPDQSVWAEGWDGSATGDCCLTHLTGSTWVTYTHSATLPVSEDLLGEIRALRSH